MQYTRLGRTGTEVSRICLGMMSFGDASWRPWILPSQSAVDFVHEAAQHGVNFFDTADIYSLGESERATGSALRTVFDDREDYVLATKVGLQMHAGPNGRGLSRKRIIASVDASLRRLGTDYIDLYQIHRWDYHTPIHETMEALHHCVATGKIRYIGASSMFAWQFAMAQHAAELNDWTAFVSMQPHYNLLYREEEREMIPFCRASGRGVLPWSPLARGMLTRPRGKYQTTARGESDQQAPSHYDGVSDATIDVVEELAKERNISMARVALAWLLTKPWVTAPIIGVTKTQHLQDLLAATEVELSDEEVKRLEANYQPLGVRGHS